MAQITHNGMVEIAVGLKVNSKQWRNQRLPWSDLVERMSKAITTPETYAQFMAANKAEQGAIKDVGGFVGGFLEGGVRNKQNLRYRSLITLDIDFSHAQLWDDFLMLYSCAALIHTTHKSCPEKPRHRLVIPLSRSVTPDEYQAVARRVAASMNINLFDSTTFDINRVMFWPSVSSDMEYYFEYQDGAFLDPDTVLATYNNWRDTTEWPSSQENENKVLQTLKKAEDPTAKRGLIGAFCRTYTIEEAINKFLPDVYSQIGEHRFTYLLGTSAGGLITYDGKFAYSHHGTDVISGKLCNAYDLVRMHMFSHLDEKESLSAMDDFVSQDPDTKQVLAEERLAAVKEEFGGDTEEDNSWVQKLDVDKKGNYLSTSNNINLIIQNDKFLRDAFKFNVFDNRRYIAKSLPWRDKMDSNTLVRDVDYSGVRNYIECVYGVVASQKIEDALSIEFEKNRFHPVKDYLESQVWDGKKRVDTLLIDYFGAADNLYTRAIIRKMLCAAVARVFNPGCKFDLSLILVGKQGTYKSTFLKRLGGEWFSDTFTTVQGKESFEQIQGVWIMEMGELAGLKKAEVETIKHYISKQQDSFRPAYGRTVETYKRQCVFFGTTNSYDFLRDPTGNRRFAPVDVYREFATKDVIGELTPEEVGQIWAEALLLYRAGESLFLNEAEEKIAVKAQKDHSEVDERTGIIKAYLDTLYPVSWEMMDLQSRRTWLNDPLSVKGDQPKNEVCIAEIWCECLGKDKKDMDRYKTREINDILRATGEWAQEVSNTKYFPLYGKQRYFQRINRQY